MLSKPPSCHQTRTRSMISQTYSATTPYTHTNPRNLSPIFTIQPRIYGIEEQPMEVEDTHLSPDKDHSLCGIASSLRARTNSPWMHNRTHIHISHMKMTSTPNDDHPISGSRRGSSTVQLQTKIIQYVALHRHSKLAPAFHAYMTNPCKNHAFIFNTHSSQIRWGWCPLIKGAGAADARNKGGSCSETPPHLQIKSWRTLVDDEYFFLPAFFKEDTQDQTSLSLPVVSTYKQRRFSSDGSSLKLDGE